MTMTITYRLNNEKNGVEIYFTEKPDEETRSLMKLNGFKWSKYNKCWYAKQTEKTISLAKQLTNEQKQVNSENITKINKEELINQLNDIDTYTVSKELQKREHDANWIFRAKEIDHTQELQTVLKSYQNQVIELIKETDNINIINGLIRSIKYFKKHYSENYIKRLEHQANNPSWVVTGRAGRNMRKDEKMNKKFEKLMDEFVQLTDGIEQRIKKYKNMIEKDKQEKKKKEIEEAIKNNNLYLEFKTVTREFEYLGAKGRKRIHIYKNYEIVKIWGAYHIFKNGQEIHSMKTTEKLEDAKKYVAYLVSQEQNYDQAKTS